MVGDDRDGPTRACRLMLRPYAWQHFHSRPLPLDGRAVVGKADFARAKDLPTLGE